MTVIMVYMPNDADMVSRIGTALSDGGLDVTYCRVGDDIVLPMGAWIPVLCYSNFDEWRTFRPFLEALATRVDGRTLYLANLATPQNIMDYLMMTRGDA